MAAARWQPGGAAATADVGCCAQQSREDVEGLVSTWWTSLSSRSAGPACQQETFKLRDYQEPNLKDTIQKEQLGLQKAFKQEKADDSNTVHNSYFAQLMTWRFTGEDLAEESFSSGCCLQHYANSNTSKMQLTIEEAKGAPSLGKKSPVEKILPVSDGTEDLIEMHDCYRQTWVQLFWIQNLKMPIFFCLNMLEICIQSILEAKLS